MSDVRYALRLWSKHPGFTAVAAATLAVGIGANAVIFCLASSLLFPPLPYRDSHRLLNLFLQHRVAGSWAASIPDFLDWKSQNRVFAQIAAASYGWATLTGGAEPEEVDTAYVTEDLFPLLGVAPRIGRTFLPEEYRPGAARVIVLGYGLWQRHFGGRADVLGCQLNLAGESYTVVGVMPPDFETPLCTKVFLPLSARNDTVATDRRNRRATVLARLKPGVTLAQARSEMTVIADRLAKAYPATNSDITVSVVRWPRVNADYRLLAALLLGAAGFVLLIGCANVANLLLARATARQKEIAVRMAIGAGRWRLIRQLLAESAVLASLGGVLGMLLAFWLVHGLNGLYSFARPLRIDFRILALTGGLVGVAALLFGSVPAFLLAKLDSSEALKERVAHASGRRSHHFRSGLVVGEIALALTLLSGAGLLIQSLLRYRAIDKGFEPHHVLNLEVNLYRDRYPSSSQVFEFGQNVLGRLELLPGVNAAAVAASIPLATAAGHPGISTPGRPPSALAGAPYVETLAVSPDFFRVMRVPLVRGRAFTAAEAEQGAEAVIVSEQLAQRLWPGEEPVGKPLKLDLPDATLPALSVIGVAKETHGYSFPSGVQDAWELYIPWRFQHLQRRPDGRFTALSFYVRAEGEPGSEVKAARGAILTVDKHQPIFLIRTMDEKLESQAFRPRVLALCVGLFGSVALLLTLVGVYGVMAYSVSERAAEIAIRLALGAEPSHVRSLFLKRGVRLLVTGLLLGLLGSVMMAALLRNQLYGISASDPPTLAGVSVLLASITLLACWLPARRAAQVDPLAALRSE